MSGSDLKITTTVQGDIKTIKIEVVEGGFLPRDIFLWSNDEGKLGEFQGVCNKSQLRRYRVWTEDPPVPSFGNRLVRYHESIRTMSPMEDDERYINIIIGDVQRLSVELKTDPITTKIVRIP